MCGPRQLTNQRCSGLEEIASSNVRRALESDTLDVRRPCLMDRFDSRSCLRRGFRSFGWSRIDPQSEGCKAGGANVR
jgi:hypothetical protein